MKRIHPLFLSIVFALVFAFGAVYVAAGTSPGSVEKTAPQTSVKRAVFEVSGVTCGSCEGKIRRALGVVAGVAAVDVNISKSTVTVEYREGETDEKKIAEAISGTGYPARLVASAPAAPAGGKPSPTRQGGCGGGCCG
jgi:copper chaperone CopZ